jgi:hypothetical protein
MTLDEDKIQAMEYMRQRGGNTTEQMEFAQFSVGFPPIGLDQIYTSYIVAKHGPAAITTDSQYMEESK